MSTKPIQTPTEGSAAEMAAPAAAIFVLADNGPELKNTSRPGLPQGPVDIDLEKLTASCNETVRVAVGEHLSSGRAVYGLDQCGQIVETRR